MNYHRFRLPGMLRKFTLPLLIFINCLLSLSDGIKINTGEEAYVTEWLKLPTEEINIILVLQIICFIVSLILTFMNGNFNRIICFLSKLVPITGLLKTVLLINSITSRSDGGSIQISDISLSAMGWVQVFVIILTIACSLYMSAYSPEKYSSRIFTD